MGLSITSKMLGQVFCVVANLSHPGYYRGCQQTLSCRGTRRSGRQQWAVHTRHCPRMDRTRADTETPLNTQSTKSSIPHPTQITCPSCEMLSHKTTHTQSPREQKYLDLLNSSPPPYLVSKVPEEVRPAGSDHISTLKINKNS